MQVVAITVVACAPWIVGIVLALRRLPRDGWIPPSLGDRIRQRLRPL